MKEVEQIIEDNNLYIYLTEAKKKNNMCTIQNRRNCGFLFAKLFAKF